MHPTPFSLYRGHRLSDARRMALALFVLGTTLLTCNVSRGERSQVISAQSAHPSLSTSDTGPEDMHHGAPVPRGAEGKVDAHRHGESPSGDSQPHPELPGVSGGEIQPTSGSGNGSTPEGNRHSTPQSVPNRQADIQFRGGPPVVEVDSPAEDHDVSRPLSVLANGTIEAWIERTQSGLSLHGLATIILLSLAPSAVMMTTSFVRFTIVLGLLRQAIGTPQLPSNHVLAAISLFMTILVMSPVWHEAYEQGVQPYTDPSIEMPLSEAWQRGTVPVRRFMSSQIELAGNGEDIQLFYEYTGATGQLMWYDEVPLHVLVPAFILSELKTAFLIGFQVYLPFLVVDLVTAVVTMSMGMFMLPPTVLSLPFKILLFVLVDGWRLVVGMLLESFQAIG